MSNNIENIASASIRFGVAGHENEYLVRIYPEPYAEAEKIPSEWQNTLLALLGKNWIVLDRGHRIEVLPPEKRSPETDTQLRDAVLQLIGNRYRLSE